MHTLESYRWIKRRVIQYHQKRELLSLRFMTVTAVRSLFSLLIALVPSPRLISIYFIPFATIGSTVAKFAGDTVHHRLAANQHFQKKDWNAALKRAFLETDEDLRASTYPSLNSSRRKRC